MFNTIRSKIMAVVVGLLCLFAITTCLSVYLNEEVVHEMRAITEYHMPLGAHVANIDVLTYELELVVRRAAIRTLPDPKQTTALRARYSKIVDLILSDFKVANTSLDAGIGDPANDPESRIAMAEQRGALKFLEKRVAPFVRIGDATLRAIETGDMGRARQLVEGFNEFEVVFGSEIAGVRNAVERLTASSLAKTEDSQNKLLVLNVTFFILAAAFGMWIFVVLTGRQHRSLDELLTATKRVESGHLDVQLQAKSRDEIGRLTNSFNQMVGQIAEKDRVKDTFGKYLDPRIVARLIEAQCDNSTASERRPATIFFSDIRGFSGMSESLTASAMVNLLNGYFSAVTREIRDKHGIIDKFIGDAVMAFWTAPFSAGDRYAADACLAALAQQKAIAVFRGELQHITGLRKNAPDFAVRMGLATGEVVIGTIGSDITKSYTVIGDIVNTASRLEGVNKVYGTSIIIDESTRRFAQDVTEARELDLLTVAGKSEPLRIYELVCAGGELAPETAELHDLYAAGLTAYRAQDWITAGRRFDECLARQPDDGPARVFQQRIKLLQASPPPGDWDGVWRITEK